MRATVLVDRALCRGSGLCEAMAPETFRVTDEGSSVVLRPRVADDGHRELAEEVAECCPAGAITVQESVEGTTPRTGENEEAS